MVPSFDDPALVAAFGVCNGIDTDGQPTGMEMPSRTMRRRYGASALVNDPVGSTVYAMLHSGISFTSATTVIMRRSAMDAIGGFQQVPGLPVMDYPTLLELGLKAASRSSIARCATGEPTGTTRQRCITTNHGWHAPVRAGIY